MLNRKGVLGLATQDISITRGDTTKITFTILGENGDRYVIDEQDRIYFTVKENYYKTECVLQRTLDNGITYNTDTEEYEIELTDECTCDLLFRRFVYDIELVIIRDGKKLVKTLVKGYLTVYEEATHKENEI